jgi:hypothetical protein
MGLHFREGWCVTTQVSTAKPEPSRGAEAPLLHGITYDVVTSTTGCPSATGVTTTRIDLTSTLQENTARDAPDTLALLPTSPAVGEVPAGACTVDVNATEITTDERGFARQPIPGLGCDAGAYEYQTTRTGSGPRSRSRASSG